MQTSTAKKNVYVHRCEHLYPMYMDEYNEKLLRSFANVASGGDSTVALSYAEQVEQLRGAEIILSNCGLGAKEITYEALREAGTVKLIVVGHSWNQFTQLDLASMGIRLVEGSNRNTVSVAEWVLTASLMGIRRLHDFDRRLKAGEEWCEPGRETYSGMLKGRRVGLIGFGRIGRYVSRLFDAFGARVLVHDDMVSDEILPGTRWSATRWRSCCRNATLSRCTWPSRPPPPALWTPINSLCSKTAPSSSTAPGR